MSEQKANDFSSPKNQAREMKLQVSGSKASVIDNIIKGVIVDDEKHGREIIKKMLVAYCPDVEIVGEADSVDGGIEMITMKKPDVVFLDIELSNRSGFEILEHFEDISFEIIFETAFNYYAIKAIKFAALDYLLKPIDTNELIAAIEKLRAKLSLPSNVRTRVNIAKDHLDKPKPEKLALPTETGFVFVKIEDIVFCKADSNYTRFYLKNKSEILTCHTLGEYDELLGDFDFFRIHNTYLVNMHHVQSYQKGKGGFAMMSNGVEIEVSVRRKDAFLKQFAKI